MYFDLDEILSDPIYFSLTATALLAAVYLVVFYRGRIRSVAPTVRSTAHDVEPLSPEGLPSISVIIYDKEAPVSLQSLLDDLFRQDYAGELEIIVTSDGHSSRSADVVNTLSESHPNLRLTFVPDEAHALSRKKLALTLGIKAARHDYVLLTRSECSIPSERWITEFAEAISSGHDMVMGHTYAVDSDGKRLNAMARFDTLADAVTYLSSAAAGHPYRADSANMAFSRRLFFDNRGFTDSVGYHHGDDDIFISHIAPKASHALLLSDNTGLPLKIHDLRLHHRLNKLSHNFTGRFVSHRSRLFFGSCSLMMWLWVAATAAIAAITLPNLLPLTVAVAAGVAWIAVAIASWRKASRVLSLPVNSWLLPATMLLRPFYNLFYRLRSKTLSERNYTWSKP